MRDLVEFVIDGILAQEKAQQMQQRDKAVSPAPDPQAGEKFRHVLASVPEAGAPKANVPNPGEFHAMHALNTPSPADHKAKDPDLWKVSLQFEAIFIQQMMSEMRKTVHKSDFMPGGFAEDVHGSMMDEAIAQASTHHSSFGIADSIYRQLEAAKTDTDKNPSIQEISHSADNLKINHDLAMEVSKHAH